jgi:hypothetical protein
VRSVSSSVLVQSTPWLRVAVAATVAATTHDPRVAQTTARARTAEALSGSHSRQMSASVESPLTIAVLPIELMIATWSSKSQAHAVGPEQDRFDATHDNVRV